MTNAGLAPLGPWAVFLTWDQPEGVDKDDLKGYRLNFTTVVVDVPATEKLMLHTQHHGITHNMAVNVEIQALYWKMGTSKPLVRKCQTLPAGKFVFCNDLSCKFGVYILCHTKWANGMSVLHCFVIDFS